MQPVGRSFTDEELERITQAEQRMEAARRPVDYEAPLPRPPVAPARRPRLPGPLCEGTGRPPAWWDADEAAERISPRRCPCGHFWTEHDGYGCQHEDGCLRTGP